jgi:hypothetical protein
VAQALSRGADWLADVQSVSGGIPAWHDGERPGGPLRSDATVQAARIWQLLSPDQYAQPIARATAFLERLQTEEGALPYEPGSDDLNTWATIFWAQLQHWRGAGVNPLSLV